MDCNNTYCYWCTFEQCCHEDEIIYGSKELQKPNELGCPSSLRSDFEEMTWVLYDWCKNAFIKANENTDRKIKDGMFSGL